MVLLNCIWIDLYILGKYTAFENIHFPKNHGTPPIWKMRELRMNNKAKLQQNIGFINIGGRIPCKAPTSTSFYFSFGPSLTMFLSNSFLYIPKKVFFLWNAEDRSFLPCPSSSFFPNQVSRNGAGLQHLCPRQRKAGRHQPSAHWQWWMSQSHAKSRTILQIACSEVLLKLRFCIGNVETCLFSSFLVESSWIVIRSNSSILIHCFY